MTAAVIDDFEPQAHAAHRPFATASALQRDPALTATELRLLYWLAAGRTNTQIAQRLMRSEKTVRNQLSQLYIKLQVSNRTEAVALYLRRGWGK